MTPAIEVEGLRFTYGGEPVLNGVSFRVDSGEAVGIMGANGSGKSTLLWCIAGLLRGPGEIRVFGETPGRAARNRLGMVFQNPEDQLFMPSVALDIALPLVNAGMPRDEARRAAADRLRRVGLDERHGSRPAVQLSLGQRKRAAIALALARDPELLVLDEPTAELDGRSVRQLVETLNGIPAAKLVATHHLEFLRQTAGRVLLLCDGRIAADGPAADILSDEALLLRAGLL